VPHTYARVELLLTEKRVVELLREVDVASHEAKKGRAFGTGSILSPSAKMGELETGS
jgi:hypothetical protein